MIKIRLSTRLVFLVGKYAIKVPLSYRGYLQCINELELFSKYNSYGLLGYLYWVKFGVVCMKRYEVCKEVSQIDVIKIKSSIPELNIWNCDLHNPFNWGFDGDKKILIDYGINERISKMY